MWVSPIHAIRDSLAKRASTVLQSSSFPKKHGDSLTALPLTAIQCVTKQQGIRCAVSRLPAQYTFPAARLLSGKLKKEQLQHVASDFVSHLQQASDTSGLLAEVDAKDGFINFRLTPAMYAKTILQHIVTQKERYGLPEEPLLTTRKKMVIDFSSPNIAKPFHAGHLRSTILGHFIATLYTAVGWDVFRLNYLGDWGKQYGLLAVGFNKYGDDDLLEAHPMKHLYDCYVKIMCDAEQDPSLHDEARNYFKLMERHDPIAMALWERFRHYSLSAYEKSYKRLGVHFDAFGGESFALPFVKDALVALQEDGLTYHSDGAEMVDLSAHKLPNVMVRKKDKTSLYMTRDIAEAMRRQKTLGPIDEMVYVAGAEQRTHFRQLFQILQNVTTLDKNCEYRHVQFGAIRGMSTRKGTAVFLDDIMDECRDHVYAIMQEKGDLIRDIGEVEAKKVAERVGLAALYVQDMKARRVKEYDFDWSRCLDTNGDTGVMLQYTHARLCGIERHAGITVNADCGLDESSFVEHQGVVALIHLLAQYPDSLASAYKSLEPAHLVHYLIQLAQDTATLCHTLRVKDQPCSVAAPRLLLFHAARQVLANGLRLLGLEPVDRM